MGNSVQLITYPNSFGGNLQELDKILTNELEQLFDGVHILPPFPSSGDHGFAPIDYSLIDPSYGTWEDMQKLGKEVTVTLDFMVNHISRQSPYFQDYLKNGKKSPNYNLFLNLQKVFESGEIPEESLKKIFLRREKPYSVYDVNGKKEKIWTTFGREQPSEQIDLDVKSVAFQKLIRNIFTHFSNNGVKTIRLDAVGYVIKKPNTSCFYVQPEIDVFLRWVSQIAQDFELNLLLEVHAEKKIQNHLIENGYQIYDFILPYRVLETVLLKDAEQLCNHLNRIDSSQITMLDCHDGIPVLPDLEEDLNIKKAEKVRDICVKNGGNISSILNTVPGSFDVHQINGTYYSLLGNDDCNYLLARGIHLFSPGTPQIYYVGFLAGENEEQLYQETGDGRELNRKMFSTNEIVGQLKKPIVKKIIEIIRFRRNHPSFNGTFKAEVLMNGSLIMRWHEIESNQKSCLVIDFKKKIGKIIYTDFEDPSIEKIFFL